MRLIWSGAAAFAWNTCAACATISSGGSSPMKRRASFSAMWRPVPGCVAMRSRKVSISVAVGVLAGTNAPSTVFWPMSCWLVCGGVVVPSMQ